MLTPNNMLVPLTQLQSLLRSVHSDLSASVAGSLLLTSHFLPPLQTIEISRFATARSVAF